MLRMQIRKSTVHLTQCKQAIQEKRPRNSACGEIQVRVIVLMAEFKCVCLWGVAGWKKQGRGERPDEGEGSEAGREGGHGGGGAEGCRGRRPGDAMPRAWMLVVLHAGDAGQVLGAVWVRREGQGRGAILGIKYAYFITLTTVSRARGESHTNVNFERKRRSKMEDKVVLYTLTKILWYSKAMGHAIVFIRYTTKHS